MSDRVAGIGMGMAVGALPRRFEHEVHVPVGFVALDLIVAGRDELRIRTAR